MVPLKYEVIPTLITRVKLLRLSPKLLPSNLWNWLLEFLKLSVGLYDQVQCSKHKQLGCVTQSWQKPSETYFMQNFTLISDLASILTSEVAHQSTRAFSVFYSQWDDAIFLRHFIFWILWRFLNFAFILQYLTSILSLK